MRSLLAGLLLTSALPAFADTFELDTNVTRALITGSGGVVTYTSEIALTPGRHTLISFLPNTAGNDSVLNTRIGDPSTVRIISQAASTEFATPIRRAESAAQISAQQALETAQTALRAYEQQIDAKTAELTAAKTQLRLIETTATTGFGTPDAGINADQIIAVTAALGDLLIQASRAHATAQTEYQAMLPKRALLQDDVTFAQAALDASTPQGHIALTQVTTEIEVAAAQTATVEFDNLEDAYWTPSYTAKLSQTGTNGTLQLHREATVSVGRAGQKPLDVWGAVDITLSTANLNERTDSYIPTPDLRMLADENRVRKSISVSGSYDSAQRADSAAMAPEPVVAELTSTSSSFAGQTLLFQLAGKNSIDWTTQTTSFTIDTLSFDLGLYALANAASDETAFLYTDLKNETGGVLLAGPVTLHRDGTLVGQTYLPKLVPNQDEPIGLGPLYGIQIQRDTLSVEKGDSGFITAKSEINRSYRTTLNSSLSYDMPIKLLDVVPTSEDEDLIVKLTASPRPTDENRDGKRGVLEWDITLPAGGETQVTFGYQMKWPSGKLPTRR